VDRRDCRGVQAVSKDGTGTTDQAPMGRVFNPLSPPYAPATRWVARTLVMRLLVIFVLFAAAERCIPLVANAQTSIGEHSLKDLSYYQPERFGDPTIQPVPPFIGADLSIAPDIVDGFPRVGLSLDYSRAPSVPHRILHLLMRSYSMSGKAFFDESHKFNDGIRNRIDPHEIIGEYFGRLLVDQIRGSHRIPASIRFVRPVHNDRFYSFKRDGHYSPAFDILISAKPEYRVVWGIEVIATLDLQPLQSYFIH
jgi:hypothetical protein